MVTAMKKIIVSTSILSADFSQLGEQIHTTEKGGTDWIHVDVMDGHFVPNITMGPFIVETCRRITDLPLDVHLMIEKPENLIEAFANAGASSLTVHIEEDHNVCRTLQHIHNFGCKAAVAINPGTPAESISAVLDFVDMILVMTVNPGYSGQSFIPEVLPKLKKVNQLVKESGKPILIEVDGGVSVDNINSLVESGASVIVSASSIFEHPQGIEAGIKALRDAVH
jgi:ribulose-phosphate 3-epimerase